MCVDAQLAGVLTYFREARVLASGFATARQPCRRTAPAGVAGQVKSRALAAPSHAVRFSKYFDYLLNLS